MYHFFPLRAVPWLWPLLPPRRRAPSYLLSFPRQTSRGLGKEGKKQRWEAPELLRRRDSLAGTGRGRTPEPDTGVAGDGAREAREGRAAERPRPAARSPRPAPWAPPVSARPAARLGLPACTGRRADAPRDAGPPKPPRSGSSGPVSAPSGC